MPENHAGNVDLLLDERLSTNKMLWWLMGLITVSAIAGGVSGSRGDLGWITLVVIGASVLILLLGLLLAYVLDI